jgi:putative hemolysin
MVMSEVWVCLIVVVALFLVGGVFSAAEMALVSLREQQIRTLSHRGQRGRAIASLTSNPNRFLSALQIGVTLSGFLSASFGGATLAQAWLTPILVGWGMHPQAASIVALVVITAAISFCAIVISELTAKRLAMQRPEAIALALAPFVNGMATVFRPIVWAVGVCTNGLVRLLGGDPSQGREEVSSSELRDMVSNATSLGAEERQIMDDVFSAGEHNLREVMVPRTEVDFLPGTTSADQAVRELGTSPHSRYPVTDGSPDQVLGFVHLRDLMSLDAAARLAPVSRLVRPILVLPQTLAVLPALTTMRRQNSHLALVVDEYGGTAGIVTLEDLVEELIGDITDEYDVTTEAGRHAQSGDIDGLTTTDEFAERTGYVLPKGPYDTLAGFFVAHLGRVPAIGDTIDVELAPLDADTTDGPVTSPWRLAVTEMDKRRIAWLRADRSGANG